MIAKVHSLWPIFVIFVIFAPGGAMRMLHILHDFRICFAYACNVPNRKTSNMYCSPAVFTVLSCHGRVGMQKAIVPISKQQMCTLLL